MPTPRKLTPKVANQIVASIRKGRPKWVAAERVGVHRETLDLWIARGEAENPPPEDEPFVAFAERVRCAAARYVAFELDEIDKEKGEGKGDWKRRAWKLRQRFPREFVERKAVELSGPEGGAVPVAMTTTQVDALFKSTFGFEGAKGASGDAITGASVSNVGGEALPVSTQVDRRGE